MYKELEACSFAYKYGDGSAASGVLVTSPVQIAGVEVVTTYGGILQATDDFAVAPKGGGIMGLSFGNFSVCSPEYTCFNPVMDDLVKHAGLDDRFAFCANGNKGKLVLGGGDDRLYHGPISRVPLVPPYSFYFINVQVGCHSIF